MTIQENVPPRQYECGFEVKRLMSDCGRVALAADEQVTFVTEGGAEYDVARKNFGFYATPSTNGRLKRFGLRAALVRNRLGQYFILLQEQGREALFEAYLREEKIDLLVWLDDNAAMAALFPGKGA